MCTYNEFKSQEIWVQLYMVSSTQKFLDVVLWYLWPVTIMNLYLTGCFLFPELLLSNYEVIYGLWREVLIWWVEWWWWRGQCWWSWWGKHGITGGHRMTVIFHEVIKTRFVESKGILQGLEKYISKYSSSLGLLPCYTDWPPADIMAYIHDETLSDHFERARSQEKHQKR